MDNKLIELIVSQGVFAILFLYLLLYVLKENRTREEKYQEIIFKLSCTLHNIEQDLKEIKNKK